ncbi:MAG: copper chaperone PCu(A)C [Thermoflexaceae bacterium]|nr:copper chaperone PCu(A)C [Thermoflexaceae bacterium]
MTMALPSASVRLEAVDLRRAGTIACSLLSIGAAVIHFAVLGEHWQEWWGYGLFFGASAWLQLAWAAAVAWRPSRTMLLLGAAGNLTIAALWLLTRTAGIPLGPASGETQAAAFIDTLASGFEVAIALVAPAIALAHLERITLRPALAAVVLGLAAVAVAVLTTVSLVDASEAGGGHESGGHDEESAGTDGAGHDEAAGAEHDQDHETSPAAASARVGNLVVSGAYVRESTGEEATAYMTIADFGAKDRLVRATSDAAADVQIHENRVEGATASMFPLDGLDIPAGGSVELKPGGLHIMLLGLRQPLEPGDTISITLEFQTAGRLALEVPVRALAATEGGGQP